MTAFPILTYDTPPAPPETGGRRTFRYTLERYHAAIAAGVLTENDPVELIFGEIIEKLPIGKRHSDCVDLLIDTFAPRYLGTHRLRAQNPVTLLGNSEPEPDFAIVDKETYAQRKGQPLAEDILLLIEVSDATLEYDRSTKLKMYALAGIQEYWIINLRQDQVEVHFDPDTESGEFNRIHRYRKEETLVSPFCGKMQVGDLLPPADEEGSDKL